MVLKLHIYTSVHFCLIIICYLNPNINIIYFSDTSLDLLPPSTFQYVVMIDAGSSGCRAHVFRYGVFSKGELYVLPKHVSFKAKPGLSSFVNNPAAAGISLDPLIKFAKSNIPEHLWQETPIFLKATAGLRMLSADKSKAILDSVRAFFKDEKSSPFVYRPKHVGIIPGHEEGAFGWISVNYLYKFIGPRKDNKIEDAFAVIEMGGASTQVTQVAPSHIESGAIPPDYKYSFSLSDGETFTVYTYSYLGMGGEQAREQVSQALVLKAREHSKSKPVETVFDPCLNTGFKRPAGIPRSDVYDGADGNFNVIGSATSADSCMKVVAQVLIDPKKGKSCPPKAKSPFTMDCVHQPEFVKKSKNVLVFENFFYAASGAGTLPAGHDESEVSTGIFPLKTSPKEFHDSAGEICSSTWQAAQEIAPKDNQPKETAKKLCFQLAYSSAFLTFGLGFDEHKEIMVQKEIDGTDIEWALGAAYTEALKFVHQKKPSMRGADTRS